MTLDWIFQTDARSVDHEILAKHRLKFKDTVIHVTKYHYEFTNN